jgi:23S rRNA (pseudouridine1915-N3)-methyltransferase
MSLRICILSLNSSNEKWMRDAIHFYEKRLNKFCEFEKIELKGPSLGRTEASTKKERDSEVLLKKISKEDYVILLDEKGKTFDSLSFSENLRRIFDLSKRKYVFVVAGPYGASDALKARAQALISLSSLTMNHWVVEIVVLEQIFRSFCILHRIPYHNA